MVLMEGTVIRSSKKRGFYHEQDNRNPSVMFKMKKPKMLELQMTGTAVSALGMNDELDKEADYNSITFSELDAAATKLQKFYRSYRTRRNLADCAVVVKELWWKALEFAALRRSSVSFFNSNKSETAVSRWARARTRAAKVGKGLLKDVKGQQLALRHWLEAIDPRHRYGHNLHLYYNVWFESGSYQPFFYWLDVGEGKEVNVDKCPRMILQRDCIKYLGQKEREAYEVMLEGGKLIYKESKMAVNTVEGSKWIFVLSTSRILYVGQKEKGHFHHSSFLSGGATISSGRLVVHHGTLHAVWAYSGHYRPTQENFMELCSFLEEHQVDMTNVKKCPIDDDRIPSKSKLHEEQKSESVKETSEKNMLCDKIVAEYEVSMSTKYKYKRSTGVRERDYPARLQFKALEQVNLSPRPLNPPSLAPITYLGLPNPSVRLSATN